MITKEQNIFYRDNGYLIVKKVLSEESCDNYLSQIKKHANKDFAAIMNPDRYETLYKLDERPKSDLTIS